MSVAAGEHRITINNYSLVIQAALAGQGVALGWRPLVDDLMERGQLVPALDRTVTTGKGYYLVHKRTGAGTTAGSCSGRSACPRSWLRDELKAGDPVPF